MITRSLAVAVAASLALGAAPALAQDRRLPAAPATRSRAASQTSKMRYYAPAQQVVLRGRVKPAVPGEVLTL